MKTVRSVLTRPCLPLILFLTAPVLALSHVTRAGSAPGLEHRFISKGEELLTELWSQGKLGNTALAGAIAARHAAHVEQDELETSGNPTFSPCIGLESQALGLDVIANDRSLSSCFCATTNPGRPLARTSHRRPPWGPMSSRAGTNAASAARRWCAA